MQAGVPLTQAAAHHGWFGTTEVPEGMVDPTNPTRTQRAKALEAWADHVVESGLVAVDTDDLTIIAQHATRRDDAEGALTEAVCAARRRGRSWSGIGTMLGMSKQAAQRRYARLVS